MTVWRNVIWCLLGLCLIFTSQSLGFQSFHGSSGLPKLNYDSLYNDAVVLDTSPRGQELVQKCIERYGGEEKLKELKSFHIEFSMFMYMAHDSITVEKFFDRSRRYKIVKHQQSGIEARILNEDSAWYTGTDTLMDLKGSRYNAELFSYLTLTMPAGIREERFSDIRYGVRSEDSLEYIYMNKADTLMIVLGISPEDYTIRSSEGIVQGDSTSFVFINKFDDFRTVDGYLFPHVLTNISMGLEVAKSRVRLITINPQISDEEFQPTRRHAKKGSI